MRGVSTAPLFFIIFTFLDATIIVNKITEEINDAYLDKHVNKNACSLTWNCFTEPQWLVLVMFVCLFVCLFGCLVVWLFGCLVGC